MRVLTTDRLMRAVVLLVQQRVKWAGRGRPAQQEAMMIQGVQSIMGNPMMAFGSRYFSCLHYLFGGDVTSQVVRALSWSKTNTLPLLAQPNDEPLAPFLHVKATKSLQEPFKRWVSVVMAIGFGPFCCRDGKQNNNFAKWRAQESLSGSGGGHPETARRFVDGSL